MINQARRRVHYTYRSAMPTHMHVCMNIRARTRMCLQVDAGTAVAIYAEDKEVAMAIGVTKMSTKDIREINKDVGVDNLHHLADGLWRCKVLK